METRIRNVYYRCRLWLFLFIAGKREYFVCSVVIKDGVAFWRNDEFMTNGKIYKLSSIQGAIRNNLSEDLKGLPIIIYNIIRMPV